eukprot:symbB.v1.2.015159.t1/scaffold1117.1/size136927/10
MPRRIIDVDWNRHHLAALEWEHRHERRLNDRLSQYHRNLEKTRGAKVPAPWVALGQSKADADLGAPLKRPPAGSAVPAVPSRRSSSQGGLVSRGEKLEPRTPSTSDHLDSSLKQKLQNQNLLKNWAPVIYCCY